MVITDYHINIKPIKPFFYELSVKHIATNRNFGVVCQSQIPPTIEGVFEAFKANHRNFFIDVESEIIKDTPPVVVPVVTPTTGSIG
jgi:hypothetical protein